MQDKKLYLLGTLLLVGFVLLAWLCGAWLGQEIAAQLFAAIAGAIVAAIITMLLLKGQSGTEELKERNMAIFNQKQEVYHRFLEELHKIVQDGQITIGSKDSSGNVDSNIDELKDLIFQLGFLQLHTSEETIKKVLDELVKMIQALNDFGSSSEQTRQQEAPMFYSRLSNSLFSVIAVLRKDLYGKESHPIDEDQIKSVLQECDLYVERADFNRFEMQKFFWDELRKQLSVRGYTIKNPAYDFTSDINQYYARARGRHRYFGFKFTKEGSPATFEVQVENSYYYGVVRGSEWEANGKISEALNSIGGFKESAWWYGFRNSTNYNLDFWNMNSAGFEELKNQKKAGQFINRIADEIDAFAQNFITEYNKM